MSAAILKRVNKARTFPDNTCPASRAVQMLGEALLKGEPYPMLTESPEHCGGSILTMVAELYEARNELARLNGIFGKAIVAASGSGPSGAWVRVGFDWPKDATAALRSIEAMSEAEWPLTAGRAALEEGGPRDG